MSGLLLVHIIAAVLTIIASATSLTAVWFNKMVRLNLAAMWGTFAVTAGTGAVLVVTTPSALMQTCVLTSAYVVALTAVQFAANRRARVSV